jgi:hypothetical protein
MICYNCGNRGHAWSTCPNRLHLCKELNLSPSRLHHLGQRDVVGDDIEEAETTDGKNATTKVEQLTESFRDLGPHSLLKTKLKTKAALKAFPTNLSFPCSIQLNPGSHTKPQDERSAQSRPTRRCQLMPNHTKPFSVTPTLGESTCASFVRPHSVTVRHWPTTRTWSITSFIFAHTATATSPIKKTYRTTCGKCTNPPWRI